MLLVKTTVASSPIHGTGIFADEFIPQGTVVWQFIPGKDIRYSAEEVSALGEPKRSEVLSLFHTYISKQSGKYIDFGDTAGNINHSTTPNLGTRYEEGVEEDVNFALRDIQPGEELTLNYTSFAKEGVDFTQPS